MHNQHAGLSQQLAAQRITERQEQAAQARLTRSAGRSRRQRHRWLTRRWWRLVHRPGSAATRALTIGAMLAAMHLAGMTDVAHAQATDQRATLRPPTERQVDERVLERQARIQRQADEQVAEPAQGPTATYPRRYPRPEPPMGTGSWLGDDRQAPPASAPPGTADSRVGLAITLAVVALLLAVGAAVTWRIHRRLRPEPTT
ncbi:MAG TPA: hypothetical protein VHM23_22370 [Actinomycetota bacterium]|jgi:hypothetical protein|nr:hypothetical protein [Actinomycetota bacterium]